MNYNDKVLNQRLLSIDALRGLVILIMMLDHVRETIYLHMQVGDPVDVSTVEPALFFSRILAHLCAPVFVFLTGLSAYLYHQKSQNLADTRLFLLKRGFFLVFLEVTVINFAWTGQLLPEKMFLQVIWAIGLSMISLALLIGLPRKVQMVLAAAIIFGHNLLDSIDFSQSNNPFKYIWFVLHDRSWIEVTSNFKMRTSYPVLPWIGIILFGWLMGKWFTKDTQPEIRRKVLSQFAIGGLIGYVVIRAINVYGDKPWQVMETPIQTLMSFLNITKYPPSLMFIMLTLSLGFFLLIWSEKMQNKAWIPFLTAYGSVPMFFYVLHLYVLKLIYIACVAIWGLTHGKYFGVDNVSTLWVVTVILSLLLYPVVAKFSWFKHSHKHIAILKYF